MIDLTHKSATHECQIGHTSQLFALNDHERRTFNNCLTLNNDNHKALVLNKANQT